MQKFVKLHSSAFSRSLELLECERVSLANSIPRLIISLSAVFGLLLFVKLLSMIWDFGTLLVGIQLPLLILMVSTVFLFSLAISIAASFLVTLSFSFSLGMSVPTRVTNLVFYGLTSFFLVLAWRSHIAWFFDGRIANGPAVFLVLILSMSVVHVCREPGFDQVKRPKINTRRLMGLTLFVAIGLVASEHFLVLDKNDRMVWQLASVYAILQTGLIGATLVSIASRRQSPV